MSKEIDLLHQIHDAGTIIHEKVELIHEDIKTIKGSMDLKEDPLLEFVDVCDILRMSERQVHRIKQQGKLKGFKIGRRRMYRTSEVNAYLRELEMIARQKEFE